jgi:hypothetical protein
MQSRTTEQPDFRNNLSEEPFVTRACVGHGIVSYAIIQRMEWPNIQSVRPLRQSFRADCMNRTSRRPCTLDASYLKTLPLRRNVPKFAIGDVVDKDKTHSGTVIAIFTTIEGEQRYAVDMEGYGALQFIMECTLVPHETPQ